MNEDFFATLDILRPVVKKQRLAEAERVLRWMTHHSMLKRGFDDAVIIGASSTKHPEENLVDLEKGAATRRGCAGDLMLDGKNKRGIWKVLALSEWR